MSRLVLCASLWSLSGHPSARKEWTLEQKLAAIRTAGFGAVSGPPDIPLTKRAEALGLRRLAAFIAPDRAGLERGLRACADEQVVRVNVQLGTPALTGRAACALAVRAWRLAGAQGIRLSIETHRGTCTETPEKLAALAARFAQVTGRALPVTWDFSHHAVVRQIPRAQWSHDLLAEHALITAADLFHLRPHTPHHVQAPFSHGRNVTAEARSWLEFAQDVLRLWRTCPANANRDILVCPEMGPRDGYGLSTSPSAWPETVRLARHLRRAWKAATAG